MSKKIKSYKEYCEEYFVLLDMYRCSTRYIHMQEYDNEETRNRHLQNFRELYHKYSNRLEKKCKKNTGYGFSHEVMKQNYFTENT